jgi:protein TonB
LKTGGLVQLARPIHRVEPRYPALARQARISGEVELAGVIGTDGRIHELKVVRGHPLLVHAALDAVRQWIWAPTTLNGDPVEVIAPIIVTFVLN